MKPEERTLQLLQDRENNEAQIVEINLPLVSIVCKKYKPYTDDQFQNGCIGLINAVRSYNAILGVPWASYACFCIEREIRAAYKEATSKSVDMQKNMRGPSFDDFLNVDDDTAVMHAVLEDENARAAFEEIFVQDEMRMICEDIIKPVVFKKSVGVTKIDLELWQKLEYCYILGLMSMESQKLRLNLSFMAKKLGVSVTYLKHKHNTVMEEIFERMWHQMETGFTDLLKRLRKGMRIPKKLLCLDPGKTTGWCVFEDGHLTQWGQLENCFTDDNINPMGLVELIETQSPDYVVYEDYKVYGHKLQQHNYSPVMTARLLGVIETECARLKIPTHKQMASTAKSFSTDAKLKSWGFYQAGQKHARDAIRHGCHFLLFYKKGQHLC